MVFGEIKTIIESNFIERYGNKYEFKESIKLFKENFLTNKDLSRMYLLYSDLSTPKGLPESEAKEYLEEGIKRLKSLRGKVDLPKNGAGQNNYVDIDNLVYDNKISIEETISSRKNIISVLMQKPQIHESKFNLPLSSTVKIANQQIKEYLNGLDESVRTELTEMLNKDENLLREEFEVIKTETINKINKLMEEHTEDEVIEKLKMTSKKISNDEFNRLNYYKLKNFKDSL
jgi:hypothetical protein